MLYYLCRELRRECGYTSELLSLPFLKLRLSRLYDAIDHQACASCVHVHVHVHVHVACACACACAWYEAITCGCTYSLTIAIDWQMDGVLAGAGAPETAPKAPNLTRSLSGDKPWRMYEASYTQVLYLLWLYLLRRMCMCMCM